MMADGRGEVERIAALYADDRPGGRIDHLRIPPQSVQAEQSVLGGLMLAPESWALLSDWLCDDDFYRRDHQLIFRSIRELAEKHQPYDAVTLGDWFESQGLAEQVQNGAYLIELASTTPSAANIVAYAEIVRDKSILRKLISVGTDAVNSGFQPDGRDSGEIITDVQQRISDLQPAQRGGLNRAAETLNSWYERFSQRESSGARITGLPLPWSGLNDATHGLQPATLYLIAARPSMGKSVMALNIAQMTAQRGKTVALFSLEMSVEDCHNRNVASLSGVPHDWIIAPTQDTDYHAKVTQAIRDMRPGLLYIDDMPSLTVRQFVARARRRHQRNPIELLVIDHIHDFKIDPKLARFEYGLIAQAAKDLGKEWQIPVVALAQLNRNVSGRTDRRPTLSDLRESGELEQKADVVIFLHREDYYDTPDESTHLQGVVEAQIAKGRNIRSGERIYLRNRFDVMRLDDWDGPLPKPAPKKGKGASFGYGGNPAADLIAGNDR